MYNAKIKNMEDIDIANLAINTTLTAKTNEVKGKEPSITNLATTAALTTVENKLPNVSNLTKKTDYNTKISKIEKNITDHDHSNKYITTLEFVNNRKFAARLKQVNLASKIDIANLVTKTDFDNKLLSFNKSINSNNTKHVLLKTN